ncbi:MAG: nitroreductase family protein [Myxococcota bacterium]|nr:nitroreductase family protein [Myxococcota bacterium]
MQRDAPQESTFAKLARTRRTIHRFSSEAVPFDAIEAAVHLAHFAPCHHRTWPWRFTYVGGERRKSLNTLSRQHKGAGLSGDALKIFEEKLIHPELVVISQRRAGDPVRAREDYAAIACAVQNMSLALHEREIGLKWSTGKLTRSPVAYELLSIDESLEEIVGFLWIGYPAQTPQVARPPVEEVFRQLS